ncbi:MAG: pantothenate kinase, partial [Sulfurimonadaceae bacterium]
MENSLMLLCDIGNTTYHFFLEGRGYKEDVNLFDPSTIGEKVFYICVNQHVKEALQGLENWIDLSIHVDMRKYYETMGIDRI